MGGVQGGGALSANEFNNHRDIYLTPTSSKRKFLGVNGYHVKCQHVRNPAPRYSSVMGRQPVQNVNFSASTDIVISCEAPKGSELCS